MSRWPMEPLGELAQVVSGTTPVNEPAYWGGDIFWATPTDLGRIDNGVLASTERRITQLGLRASGCKLIPKGSVVMSSRAPIGHLAVAEVDFCTNQGCKSFVPSERIRADFLYWQLRMRMSEIQGMGSGTTFLEVGKVQLQKFEVLLPSPEEQRRIVAQIEAARTQTRLLEASLQRQLADLAALDQAVLREAFA